MMHANLYDGVNYDFLPAGVSVPPGGEWRRYETTIEAGDFPQGIQPVFRLWVTEKDKEVLVSGVSVEPALPQGGVRAELGEVEALAGR